MYACEHETTTITYKLLDEGADYEIKNNDGKTFLDRLKTNTQNGVFREVKDYIKYVLSKGKNIKSA